MINQIARLAPPAEHEGAGLAFGDARDLLSKLAPRWLESLGVQSWEEQIDWVQQCAEEETQVLLLSVHQVIGGTVAEHPDRSALKRVAVAFNPRFVGDEASFYEQAVGALWKIRSRLIRIAKQLVPVDDGRLEDEVEQLTIALEAIFPEVIVEDLQAIAQRISEVEERA